MLCEVCEKVEELHAQVVILKELFLALEKVMGEDRKMRECKCSACIALYGPLRTALKIAKEIKTNTAKS